MIKSKFRSLKLRETLSNISAPRSISILRKEILDEMQSSDYSQLQFLAPAESLGKLKSTLVIDSAKKLIERVRAKKAEQKMKQPISGKWLNSDHLKLLDHYLNKLTWLLPDLYAMRTKFCTRREIKQNHSSFLRVIKPEIEFPISIDPYSDSFI